MRVRKIKFWSLSGLYWLSAAWLILTALLLVPPLILLKISAKLLDKHDAH